jgi:predicted Fe-S protein YdhL (DUF1289 family)
MKTIVETAFTLFFTDEEQAEIMQSVEEKKKKKKKKRKKRKNGKKDENDKLNTETGGISLDLYLIH